MAPVAPPSGAGLAPQGLGKAGRGRPATWAAPQAGGPGDQAARRRAPPAGPRSGRRSHSGGVSPEFRGRRSGALGPLSRCLCAFVSPQVLGFADELPAYAQHLLPALCHFLLLGLGDSQSLLRPGVWAGGPGAAGLLTAPRRGKGAVFPPRPGASGSAGGTAVALLPLSSAFPSRRRRWGPGTTQAPRRCSRCSERAGGAGWTCTAAWRTPGTGAAPCCCGVRSRPRPGPCP